MTDQPPHPRTRTLKPVCTVCSRAFSLADRLMWRIRGEDDEFYHEGCANETVKAAGRLVEIRASV